MIFTWPDLITQNGGFYSAEDADSLPTSDAAHKKEGAFCVWKEDEVKELLKDKVEGSDNVTLADVFSRHYGVTREGNVDFEQVCMEDTDWNARILIKIHYLHSKSILYSLYNCEIRRDHFR